MKYDNQLRYATSIVEEYDGTGPLHNWLSEFFRRNKQMGSSDRRTVSELVYSYYRLGHQKFQNPRDRFLTALSSTGGLPELSAHFGMAESQPAGHIFPWIDQLSDGVSPERFANSFLLQPDLFVRIRPHKKERVLSKLSAAGISWKEIGDDALALPNRTKLEDVLQINRDVVVQDVNSQRTAELMKEVFAGKIWDCCAASGGKSILAADIFPGVTIYASDIRSSILANLNRRFAEAGISNYHSFISDLGKPDPAIPGQGVDFIIADLPCTGSGTWARTPEQLYFFKEERIDFYASLQRKILRSLIAYAGGRIPLLYITCSVFRKENEENVRWLTDNSEWKLQRMELLSGYEMRADSLFAALFIP